MCLPDRAREMSLKLHGIPPGKEEEFLEESPFMGIPVAGNFRYQCSQVADSCPMNTTKRCFLSYDEMLSRAQI